MTEKLGEKIVIAQKHMFCYERVEWSVNIARYPR